MSKPRVAIDYLGVGPLTDPLGIGRAIADVVVKTYAPDERTPIYDAARDAVPEDWVPGSWVVCECGRTVKARRDWAPVRHYPLGMVGPGAPWCTGGPIARVRAGLAWRPQDRDTAGVLLPPPGTSAGVTSQR